MMIAEDHLHIIEKVASKNRVLYTVLCFSLKKTVQTKKFMSGR